MARLPIILEQYLETTGQMAKRLSEAHLLNEAEWCLYNAQCNEGSAAYAYPKARKDSLERYVDRLKAKGVKPKRDFD